MATAVRMDGVDAAVDDTRIPRFAGWRRPTSDAALVRAAQAGSERAVEELFGRHWDDAYRAALLVTHDRGAAEDIAQEAFLAALRALPRFDRRRPLRPWLHRIVVNRAIDFARARRLRREVDADAVPEPPAVPDPPLAELGSLGPAIASLCVEQRAVVVMRYLLDMTPGEIAAALELPSGTVNSRLRRGLDALGETLRRESAPGFGPPAAPSTPAAPGSGAPATPDRESEPRPDARERRS